MAVNHDGDSDSTGAIVGNILGTYLGIEAIPSEWRAHIELKDEIEQVAGDLYYPPGKIENAEKRISY
jgi:ADP-ribosylglycohydrolase